MFAMVAASLLLQSPAPYVVVSGMPVGRYSGGKWSSVGTNKPVLSGSTLYEVGLKEGGSTNLHSVVEDEVSEVWSILTGSGEGEITNNAFLIGRKPTWPRTVETLASNSAVYNKELKAYFAAVKASHLTPRITQILRVDLDGDKVKDVLIVARSKDEPIAFDAKKTDYSIVLLRHVVKGKVVSSPLYFDQIKQEPGMSYINKVEGIADLDGDGNMEIIATSDYYEGGSASIWRLKSGKLTKLAENGVGV